ncbi:MAG: CoA transferase [Bacteroidetes bacterium]|nr:CoA transferase [Bacteroidota bacterium]
MSDQTNSSTTWPADPMLDPSLPLSRMKIMDITSAMAGPCCSEMLADMGADVIKIESPSLTPDSRGGPPVVKGESGGFLIVNRNKRSLTLNLKDPRGKEIFLALAKNADVLLENVRPGTLDKLGLGYEDVKKVNPAIIYASISGFGKTSPYAKLGGYDAIAQGISGMMLSIGEEGRPPVKAGVPLSDFGASIFTAYGILVAYIYRVKTGKGQPFSPSPGDGGKGQLIDTALLDVPIALQVKQMLYYFLNGKLARRMGSGDMDAGPYRAFKTKDGGITLGGTNVNLWPKMCKALGVEELINDPRFDTPANRNKNGAELTELFKPLLMTKTTGEWLASLRANGVPAGPVNNLAQAVADPQVKARELIVEVDHPKVGKFPVVGMPVKFSRTPGKIRRPPPMLGEHTDEILAAMGYDPAHIGALRADGVV